VIIDPVCATAWYAHSCGAANRVAVVCGGGVRNNGSFAIEYRLKAIDMARYQQKDAGFRVSFTLTEERSRP
jgi:hypothetical protein